LQQLKDDQYEEAGVVFTASGDRKTTGPWNIDVIEIHPDQFQGKIASKLATGIIPPGKNQITDVPRKTDALAAVNGGYFVVGPNDGTPGDLAAFRW
jgi:hypothetical protein